MGSSSRSGAVVLNGVTRRFGDVVAVNNLDLEIVDREFLVLLGPSGCGKSTALRMIAGLDLPDEGTIEIAGEDVTDVVARDRDVAMVFQSYALYPHMSVRKNIEFPLRNRKVPKAEMDAAVAEASRVLGLDNLLDRRPAQLSGGQRQRVALARAIVRRPTVFLMDEPLSNLDAKLRVQTRAELIDLQRRLETTVVYVTHDQVEAMTMGHRIAVMVAGVLQQVGPPGEVYDRPANVFVAGFIGNPPMNLLDGKISTGTEQAASVTIGSDRLELPGHLTAAAAQASGGEAVVGVRPEHLSLASSGGITAKVTVIESLGHERHVVCTTPDGQGITVRIDHDDPVPADDETVHVVWDPDAVHIFDRASGDRLDP
ncbi:MAG: ABC transporter ATP-binding protein [Acidimicrobiales bacterium]